MGKKEKKDGERTNRTGGWGNRRGGEEEAMTHRATGA